MWHIHTPECRGSLSFQASKTWGWVWGVGVSGVGCRVSGYTLSQP
ncbi:hypothetical protein [Coleofasciculus sp. E2-BRE-01]